MTTNDRLRMFGYRAASSHMNVASITGYQMTIVVTEVEMRDGNLSMALLTE